ncbi:MAG: phosphatidylglycerophosphatase A [Acidobacteriota bacterium]
MARALATVGGLGDLLPAPGTTVGSVAGVVLFAGAWHLTGGLAPWTLLAGACLLVAVAVPACGREATRRGQGDPGAVVLDETAGQWVALAMWVLAHPAPLTPGVLAASFLLFRLFDVAKPWPIRRLERLPGGWGIVADDLAAGAAAGGVHLLLAALWP